MRNTTYILGIAAIMVGSSQAATVQVDFGATGGAGNGTTSEGGTTWNGVEPGASGANLTAGGSQTFGNLVDSANGATTIDLKLDWSNQSGLDFSRAWDLHQGDRDGDYLGIKGDNAGVYNTASFSDLTVGGQYNVTVWTQAPTDFRANGGTVQVVSGIGNDTANTNAATTDQNLATSYTFTNITATGGVIAIDWGHITSARGADQWATTTAMSITAVPEPSAAALLGLGLVGFIARRRRA